MDVWVMCCITHTHIHTHMHSHALRNYCYCCYLCSTLGCYLLANTCFWIIFYVHFGLTCVDTHPHTHTHTPYRHHRRYARTHLRTQTYCTTHALEAYLFWLLVVCCLQLLTFQIWFSWDLNYQRDRKRNFRPHIYTHATMCVFVCVALYIYVCVCLWQF